MLQEVGGVPDRIRSRYECHSVRPRFFSGRMASFSTVVLSKWAMDTNPVLISDLEWVNEIVARQPGWIVECQVVDDTGARFQVVSVHSPAWPVPKEEVARVDLSGIKLKNNPDLWFTELLWSLLRNANLADDANWIVGGDFNSSVKFDFPRDRGNREIVARMNALGLTDCLSDFNRAPVPTFQNTRKGVRHQLDYCYVNGPMLERLATAKVLSREEVFDRKPRLSDHLPILCDFQ